MAVKILLILLLTVVGIGVLICDKLDVDEPQDWADQELEHELGYGD